MASSPAQLDLKIYAGSLFAKRLTYYSKSSTGVKTPIDLTGFGARLVAKINETDAAAALEFSTVDGSIVLGGEDGTIDLLKTPLQTSAITSDEFSYVLFLIDPDDNPLPPIVAGGIDIDFSTMPSGG